MKTLINLLNETNVGKYLFADKEIKFNKDNVNNKFLNHFQEFNSIDEPNTDDENRLLYTIYDYFKDNKHTQEVYNAFNELLTLKNKYPKILDPLYAHNSENKIEHNKVYRCITMSISDFNKLVDFDDYGKFYDECVSQSNNKSYIKIQNIKQDTYTEGTLFLSFAANFKGAENMALYRGAFNPSYEQPIIIFECNYNQLKNKSILNPDFSEVLNPYGNENEFIYLDTTYKFANMYFYL